MRHWGLLAAGLLLILGGAQARTLLDVGPVAVRADMNSNADCTIGLDDEICAASWRTNGTLLPGDDEVAFNKTIQEVGVWIRGAPEGPPRSLTFNVDDVSIDNPIFSPANKTWKALNSTLPEPFDGFVALDSSEQEAKPGVPATWGLSVVIQGSPGTPADIAGADQPRRFWVLCWDLYCGFLTWELLWSDEEQVHLGPGHRTMPPFDSDEWMENDIAGPDGAFTCKRIQEEEVACLDWALAPGRAVAADGVERSESVTPRVTWADDAERVSVHVSPHESATGPERVSAPFSVSHRAWESKPLHAQRSPRFGEAEPLSHERGAGALQPVPSASEVLPKDEDLALSRPAQHQHPLPRSAPVILVGGVALGILAAWVLYTRLQRERALSQQTRRRVYEAICQEPGIRAGTLATRLDLAHNTVLYHIRVLESFTQVKQASVGRGRYGPAGRLSPEQEARYVGALSRPSIKAAHDHLCAAGPSDLRSLAQALGLAYSTASEAMTELCGAQLASRKRVGKRWVFCAVPLRTAPPVSLGSRTFRET